MIRSRPPTDRAIDSLPPDGPEAELNPRRLLWSFGLGVVGVIGLFAVVGQLLREPLVRFAEAWVAKTGLVGLMGVVALFDGFPTPVPPDVFMSFAMIGGIPFWQVVLAASLGSVAGGTLAWTLATRFRTTARFQRFITGRGAASYALVRRYGTLALVLGAVSPVPFSLTCYAAGAVEMPLGRFVLVALLRAPRMAFYLWLIQLGWVGLPT